MCPPLQPAPQEPAPRHFPLSASPAGRVLSPCCCTTSPTSMTGFPQPLCTTCCDVTPRLCRDGHGLPRQRHGAALAGAVSCWRSAVAGRSGSRTSGRSGMPVCAAARGPVSAAADTASPLDCPRRPLGCQAMFLPPVGSATRANNRCALPRPSAPRGGTAVSTGAAALRPCHRFLSPRYPRTGVLRIACRSWR